MSEPVARTVKDFCRAYGIGKSSVYREIAAGRLQTVKYGATTLIPEESAKAWWNSIISPSTSDSAYTSAPGSASTSASTSDAGIGRVAAGRPGKSKKKRQARSIGYEPARVG